MDPYETITVDFHFTQQPSSIWRTLTEPDLVGQWLMPNDIAPTVGHTFTFRTLPMGGWDGEIVCEVLAAIRNTKLAYTWQSNGIDKTCAGEPLSTIVTWKLFPTPDNGTRLHLTHEGFRAGDLRFEALAKGWHHMGPRIAAVAATLPVSPECLH